MSLRIKLAQKTDMLADIFGLLFAICAFAPMGLLNNILPFEGSPIRDYIILCLGLIPLAPFTIIFLALEYLFMFITNQIAGYDNL